MVEINAYSKAASGGKQLSAHFKVREFVETGLTLFWWLPGW